MNETTYSRDVPDDMILAMLYCPVAFLPAFHQGGLRQRIRPKIRYVDTQVNSSLFAGFRRIIQLYRKIVTGTYGDSTIIAHDTGRWLSGLV